jgi:hypothetical protein
MADAPALGAGGSNPMEVQVLSRAPFKAFASHGKPFLLFFTRNRIVFWIGIWRKSFLGNVQNIIQKRY